MYLVSFLWLISCTIVFEGQKGGPASEQAAHGGGGAARGGGAEARGAREAGDRSEHGGNVSQGHW